jgi:hypothetical protein
VEKLQITSNRTPNVMKIGDCGTRENDIVESSSFKYNRDSNMQVMWNKQNFSIIEDICDVGRTIVRLEEFLDFT